MRPEFDFDTLRVEEAAPYFRVEFQPLVYRELRFKTLHDLKRAMYSCRVSRRGWPVPFIRSDESNIRFGEGFFEGGWNSSDHTEHWRLYRSGQFVFKSSIRELAPEGNRPPMHYNDEATGAISYTNWVYNLTEVCEFAYRLASMLDLEEGPFLSVGLINVKGVTVGAWGNDEVFFTSNASISYQGTIPLEAEMSVPQTVENYDKEARSLFTELMQAFDLSTKEETIVRAQNELLSMRIGSDTPRFQPDGN